MNSLVAFLTPLALLLPAVAADLPAGRATSEDPVRAAPEPEKPAIGFGESSEPLRILHEARRTPLQNQVRIEQRVIIRIAPSTQRGREQMMARLARDASEYREVKTDDCVPVGSIAAVYPSEENRLLLFMRDRRVLSAALERACNAQDFYSGFYVERSEDGQLCSRRDRLQSRAGANCRMTQINRLVAERD